MNEMTGHHIHSLWAIAKKELKSYFDHPTAYLILIVFLVLNSFFYFRSSFLVNIASLRPMFDTLLFILLFFIPSLTMRLLSEEKKTKTIENLLSQPISEWHIIMGKIIGVMIFLLIALLLTIPIPLTLSSAGSFDLGMVVSQYIGTALLMGSMASIGLFASSISNNQVISFIFGLVITFIFIIAGFDVVLTAFDPVIKSTLEQLSITWHYSNISRGVIDLRDVLYFISASVVFILLSIWFFIRDRIATSRPVWRRMKAGIALIVVFVVVLNILGLKIHGRLDFTKQKLYTLSPATKTVVSDLRDLVTITLVRSKELPSEMTTTIRDVQDILRDIDAIGEGNIRIIDQEVSSDRVEEVVDEGIAPVQFNVVKSDEFQVKKGVFGLTIQHIDEKEIIPFIEKSDDFEYRLISLIRKLTNEKKKTVGFLEGHGEKSIYSDYGTFVQALREQYDVQSVTYDEKEKKFSPSFDVLVIAGPTNAVEGVEKEALKQLFENGKLLILNDEISINDQTMEVTMNLGSETIDELLASKDLTMVNNLVGDLRSSESVTLNSDQYNLIVPYPLWIRGSSKKDHPVNQNIENIVLPWVSSMEIKNKNSAIAPLFQTTEGGFLQSGTYVIRPDYDYTVFSENLGTQLLAVALDRMNENQSGGSRMIIVGDSDFLTENFSKTVKGNVSFGLNAIDWLASDELLMSLRTKHRQPNALIFTSPQQKNALKIGNMVGVPLFIAIVGFIRLTLRRKKIKQ